MKQKFTLKLMYGLFAFILISCGSDSIGEAADQSVQQLEEAGITNMRNDALFVAEAASANMLQIQLGDIALERGLSPEVKGLAQQMAQDHGRIQEELQTLANQSNFVLPSELGSAHSKSLENVTSHNGIAFDIAYVKEMVSQHRGLVKRFEDMATNGVSMDVKTFASKQLPLLREHLQMAERIENAINNV